MVFIPYVVFFFFFAYTYQYAVNQRHFFFKTHTPDIHTQKQDSYEEHNNTIFKNHYIFLWSKNVTDKTAFS